MHVRHEPSEEDDYPGSVLRTSDNDGDGCQYGGEDDDGENNGEDDGDGGKDGGGDGAAQDDGENGGKNGGDIIMIMKE